MPPPRPSIDPLWACLCPALIRPAVLTGSASPRSRPTQTRDYSSTARSCVRQRTFRLREVEKSGNQGNVAAAADDGPPRVALAANDARSLVLRNWDVQTPFPAFTKFQSHQFSEANVTRFRRKLLKHGLEDLPTIYKVLEAAGDVPDPVAVENWVRFLIQIRGEKPNRLIYLALLKTCAHHEYGSVMSIKRLILEMDEHGIARDATFYDYALRALAAHPSYTLRISLMEEMRSKWMTLSPEAWHYVCCAQIREKQIEMAVETVFKMRDELKVEPQTWLLDMLVHVLTDLGEMDVAAQVFSLRLGKSHSSPTKVLWSQMLTKAAENYHHPVVSNAWWAVVAPGHLNPSTGLCTMVLDTAARAGDDLLAIDVLRIMSSRSTPIHTYHYEALIEAHLRATTVDMPKVLAYLSTLEDSQPGAVDVALTRPLSIYLRENISDIDKNIEHIRDLKTDTKSVPIAILNAVLEAIVKSDQKQRALPLYECLHEFSADGVTNPANTATFSILLSHGSSSRNIRKRALFLAAEMVALQVPPDATIYQALIKACLSWTAKLSPLSQLSARRDSVNDAWQYLEEMEARKWLPSEDVLSAFAENLSVLEDDRFFPIIDRMNDRGFQTKHLLVPAPRLPSKEKHATGLNISVVQDSDERDPDAVDKPRTESAFGDFSSERSVNGAYYESVNEQRARDAGIVNTEQDSPPKPLVRRIRLEDPKPETIAASPEKGDELVRNILGAVLQPASSSDETMDPSQDQTEQQFVKSAFAPKKLRSLIRDVNEEGRQRLRQVSTDLPGSSRKNPRRDDLKLAKSLDNSEAEGDYAQSSIAETQWEDFEASPEDTEAENGDPKPSENQPLSEPPRRPIRTLQQILASNRGSMESAPEEDAPKPRRFQRRSMGQEAIAEESRTSTPT